MKPPDVSAVNLDNEAIPALPHVWGGSSGSGGGCGMLGLELGLTLGLAALWRRRSVVPIAVAVAALLAVSLGVPQARHRILGKAGFSHATGGRSKLVSNGIKVALHHPVIGVGTGGFRHAYAKQTHLKGKEPKAAASHDTPITVAAETGLPGLALFAWLVGVAFLVPFRRNPVRGPTGRAGRTPRPRSRTPYSTRKGHRHGDDDPRGASKHASPRMAVARR